LLERLIVEEQQRERRAARVAAGRDPFGASDEVDPVLLEVFKASYMKPLKKEAKEYCRQGHELERPYMEELFEHSTAGLTGNIRILGIHSSPLVGSKNCDLTFFLDSADSEAIYVEEGSVLPSKIKNENCDVSDKIHVKQELPKIQSQKIKHESVKKVMPVECKARLSHTSFFNERSNLEASLGAAAWESGEPVYIHVDAQDPLLYKWIPHESESFQLLHHVVLRDAEKGLIVVGNKRKIIFGVFVSYSTEVKEAYRCVLHDLYERGLSWAYGSPEKIPFDKIKNILLSKTMKGIKMSRHSFLTSYHCWRKLRVERDNNAVPLPLPPCNRILPYIHSFWNNVKGASDTATKLFWSCQAVSTVPCPQIVVAARFFQLYAVLLHRMYHVATADTDLNTYSSLFHFRNSRNVRYPFHETVQSLSYWLLEQAQNENKKNLPHGAGSQFSTPKRSKRDNPRRPFAERRNWASTTGATPGKGRARFQNCALPAVDADHKRLATCPPGFCYPCCVPDSDKPSGMADQRQKCWICKTNTKFKCILCKRFYCMVNRDEKIRDLIAANDPAVAFLNGKRPPTFIEIPSNSPKGGVTIVRNTCYHIQHAAGIAESIKAQKLAEYAAATSMHRVEQENG